uniref:U-scoloptoxin(21)-Sm1a n=1 Tax=Scolopendra morsitans TaxID=943129 RepID=TXL1A_SCOMO|nr:RecName: Full=U-scoloptoxin(21)-Sm1a; Short=U-SLPTX(21)-Sm1a; Flags: Precursor [Scolopendra morsitans]
MKSVIFALFLVYLLIVRAAEANENIGLGLDRGSSGTIAAKQQMGIELANDPNGPGRRRRAPAENEDFLKHS